MNIHIDNQSKIPLFKQISGSIKELIKNNNLKAGDRLPTTRKLAADLNVNRSTICKAYEELISLGYVESKQGSYTFVRERKEIVTPLDNLKPSGFNITTVIHKSKLSELENIHSIETYNKETNNLNISVNGIYPHKTLINKQEIKRSLSQTIQNEDELLEGRIDSIGYYPLRAFLANRMFLHSVNCTADDICITNGLMQTYQSVFQYLLKEGDTVVIEKPVDYRIVSLLSLIGAKVIEIDVADNGFDLEEFINITKKRKIKVLCVSPSFQYPSGYIMPQQTREKVLEYCEKKSIIIIENGLSEELKCFGKAPLPIKSMDKKGIVFYIGSLSAFYPKNIDLSWIVAGKNNARNFGAINHIQGNENNALIQGVVFNMCKSGLFELQIRKVRNAMKRRITLTVGVMSNLQKKGILEYSKPNGGFCFVLRLLKNQELLAKLEGKNSALLKSTFFQLKSEAKDNRYYCSMNNVSENQLVETLTQFELLISK